MVNFACRLLVEALDPAGAWEGGVGLGRGEAHVCREGFALALQWSLEARQGGVIIAAIDHGVVVSLVLLFLSFLFLLLFSLLLLFLLLLLLLVVVVVVVVLLVLVVLAVMVVVLLLAVVMMVVVLLFSLSKACASPPLPPPVAFLHMLGHSPKASVEANKTNANKTNTLGESRLCHSSPSATMNARIRTESERTRLKP